MKRRYTLRYRYSTDNGVTWTDFSDAVDSAQTTITQNLCTNQFKSAKDSVNFTLPATSLAVKNQLVEDLLGDKDLLFEMDIPTPVPVKWSGNDVQWDSNEVMWRSTAIGFTGYIDRSSVDLRSYPLPTSLSLTAYDVSFLTLDKKVDQNMVLKNKTITEIVHTLLGIAGYSYDASSVEVADNVTLEAFVVDKDDSKTYREYIDTLLFEAGGYVLDFMPNGIARIFRIPWDDANGPLRTINNPMNESGIQIKSSWMQNDGVKVKWSTLEWSDANRRVWRDSINRTLPGSVMQGETLAPGDYWPKNAELKPAYMEYSAEWLDDPYLLLDTRKQNEDLSVIMVDNPWADIRASHEDGSQYTFPVPAGYPIPADFQVAPYNFTSNPMIWPSVPTWTAKKAWYLLYNSSNENIILTSFEIKGKVLYRSRINTLETDGSTNPKEYTSTYIYDATQAQTFLNFYWHFLNTSRFSMTWSEPMLDEDLGDVVEITQKGMAYTQDAVIVAKTMRFINDKTPVISYSAVGVAVPVLSNGVANSLVPQGGSGTATYDEVAIEQKVEELEVDVKTWDFDLNSVIYPVNLRDLSNNTHIIAKSQVKGYPSASLEWEARDASGTTIATGSGSTFDFYIPLSNSYTSPISVIMSDNNGSIPPLTKTIDAIDETEYDHDFAVWEPTDDGTNIFILPDHFTVSGVDYDIIKGDYFVSKVTFAPYSEGTAIVSPSGDPEAQGWYERKGSGTNAKPYYWQKTSDTSVVTGKTYGTVGAGNQKFEAGYAYMYSGSSWDGFDITDEANARKAANLLGDLVTGNVQIPESASNFSMWKWAKNFAAQYAIINNLFSQAITILSGGHIKGGDRYDASGTIVDWSKKGFWFGSDGRLMASLQSDGDANTYIGTDVATLYSAHGSYNTAVGYQAMYCNNTGGNYNVALGYQALYGCGTGTYNVAIGYQALFSASSNSYNIAIGYQALENSILGDYNIAIGYNSMFTNNGGTDNVAIGWETLTLNVSGQENVAVGSRALAKTTGNHNTALGAYSMRNNTSGGYNVSIGSSAMYNNTTGVDNVAIGYHALYQVTTGKNNIGIGSSVQPANNDGCHQMNFDNALLYFEFRATRQGKEIYNTLHSYYNSNVGSRTVGATGVFDNDIVTGIGFTSNSVIIYGRNSTLATIGSNVTATYSGRTMLMFVNPYWNDTRGADCLGS